MSCSQTLLSWTWSCIRATPSRPFSKDMSNTDVVGHAGSGTRKCYYGRNLIEQRISGVRFLARTVVLKMQNAMLRCGKTALVCHQGALRRLRLLLRLPSVPSTVTPCSQ